MLSYFYRSRTYTIKWVFTLICVSVALSACSKKPSLISNLMPAGIMAAASTHNGEVFLTANIKGGATLWQTHPLKPITELLHHKNDTTRFTSIAISPNGKLALTATEDEIVIWEVEHNHMLLIMSTNSNITSAAIADNGFFVIGYKEHIAEAYTVEGSLIGTMNHAKLVNKVTISNNGQYVVTASDDNSAKLWDLVNQKKLHDFKHQKYVTFVAISPSNKYLITSSSQHDTFLWDLKTGKKIQDIHLGPARFSMFQQKFLTISAVQFNDQEDVIYIGTPPNFIRHWSIKDEKFIDYEIIPSKFTFKTSSSLIYALALPNPKNLQAITANGFSFNFEIE